MCVEQFYIKYKVTKFHRAAATSHSVHVLNGIVMVSGGQLGWVTALCNFRCPGLLMNSAEELTAKSPQPLPDRPLQKLSAF